jgi:hypothetical protein
METFFRQRVRSAERVPERPLQLEGPTPRLVQGAKGKNQFEPREIKVTGTKQSTLVTLVIYRLPFDH